MKSLPIDFNDVMILAILAGQKTVTRRPIKPHPRQGEWNTGHFESGKYWKNWPIRCNFDIGDELWVREDWRWKGEMLDGSTPNNVTVFVEYAADFLRKNIVLPREEDEGLPQPLPMKRWEPEFEYEARCYDNHSKETLKIREARWMPHWASRITLKVTDIKIERLQSISPEDARKEGASFNREYRNLGDEDVSLIYSFENIWNSIYKFNPLSWENNPWVWAIEFKVVTP